MTITRIIQMKTETNLRNKLALKKLFMLGYKVKNIKQNDIPGWYRVTLEL